MRADSSWIVMFMLRAATGHADPPADDRRVLPCRPTIACTAELAPPGTLELELGYQLRRIDDGAIYQNTTPFLGKLVLATWLEAQLGTNGYTYTPTAHYVDNITIGAKFHLVDQAGPRPALAVTVTGSVPTVSQLGYTRVYDLFVVAAASKDWGKLHVDWNAGLYTWQLDGGPSYQPFTALAASYPITGQLSVTAEPHYLGDASPIAPRDAGAIAGVTYAIRPWLVVDGAIEVVVVTQTSVSALAGISIAPIRIWGGP